MKTKKTNYLLGAAILAGGGIFAKFLGMFFKIPLNSLIGSYGLGLYSYAYPLYTAFLSISTIGLPVAVAKMVSERVSIGNYKGAYKVFYTSFYALSILGGTSALIMFLGANFFIGLFHWDPNTYYCILSLALAPLFVSMVSSFRGFFQGMQSMGYSSVSQIIDQIGRVGVGLALAYVLTNNYGVEYGAAGATFGATAGAIVAFLFLFIAFILFKKKQQNEIDAQVVVSEESTKQVFKKMIVLAIPVAAGGLVNTVMELINSATIASCLQRAGLSIKIATEQFGLLEQRAQTLVNVPLVLAAALAASLVPAISQSYAKNDIKKAISKTSMALRVSFIISMPCAIGLSVLSEPIMKLLFSSSGGADMLKYLAYVVVFSAAMSSMQGVLQGSGRFYTPLKNIAIGATLKLILNIILISNPNVGVMGAVYSSIIATAVIFTLNLKDVIKHIGLNPVLINIAKTFVISIVMGVCAYFTYNALSDVIGFKIGVLVTIAISVVIYFGLIIITKTFTKKDIQEVRE